MSSRRYDRRLIPWLAGNEGKVNRWYRDPIGVPTIGMGFTMRSREFKRWWAANRKGMRFGPGATMTDAEIYDVKQMLIDAEYGPPVWRFFGAVVSANAMAAAMDMVFNAGAGSLKWSWAKLLKSGNVKAAAARFRTTATTAAGRRLAGLVRRRKEGATIMEHNIWPAWVRRAEGAPTVEKAVETLPAWKLDDDDFLAAAGWLETLGYWKPAGRHSAGMLRASADFRAAVKAFQREHPNLDDDGVLGRATRDQLQRVMDLRRKAATQSAGPATAAGGGAATQPADVPAEVSVLPDVLLWGGLAMLAVVLGVLAWRYRDELSIAVRSLKKRKARV